MNRIEAVKGGECYAAIVEFYGDRKAERSGVRLMQHIDDGLVVLDEINASVHAMQAWCLHPMFQADEDLVKTVHRLGPWWSLHGFEPHVILLVMEYRNRANAWLSGKVRLRQHRKVFDEQWTYTPVLKGLPYPGDLEEVWHMLIADKVQNLKDFTAHHKDTHPRRAELEGYFAEWLKALDVDEAEYEKLCAAIDAAKS